MIKLFHDLETIKVKDKIVQTRARVCCEGWRELFIKVGRERKVLTKLAGGRRSWKIWMTQEVWVTGEVAQKIADSVARNFPVYFQT